MPLTTMISAPRITVPTAAWAVVRLPLGANGESYKTSTEKKSVPMRSRARRSNDPVDEESRMKLAKYAEFLDCSPSYVVTEALKLVYSKDKEFQSWLADQHVNKADLIPKGESFQLELK